MRRFLMLATVATFGVAFFFQAPVLADYVGHPGQAPGAGAVESGAPSVEGPVQVLGEHFVRAPAGGFAATGADIAELVGIALVAIAAGTVLVRVRRGRQPQLA